MNGADGGGGDSIWYYSKNGFREFVNTISDKSVTVAEALSTFRELGVLPKEFRNMTVQELCDSPNLIGEVYDALRKMQAEKKFRLEYKIADREQELKETLADNYSNIDVGKAQAKVITGRYQDKNGIIDFCYALEVAIAPEVDISGETVKRAGQVEFIGYINNGTSTDNGESYFSNGNFRWFDKKKHFQMEAKGIRDLLAECGFATNMSYTKRKVPCVLFVNLLTPLPNWMGSAGKTQINLAPYEDDIAKVVSDLAYKMPSYHGKGFGAKYQSTGLRDKQKEDKRKATEIFEQFLRERYQKILEDPILKLKDRWNTSTPVYQVRPILEKAGLGHLTRRYLQGLVRDICKNKLHKNREELGIYEEARALLYFKGKIYPVSFELLQHIKHLGSHIFIVEKHGPIDLEIAFADRYGVALCETGGFLTDNAKELCKLAKEEGGNMVIVTDEDFSGWVMASKVRDAIPRIGITLKTLKRLNVPIDKVSENLSEKSGHRDSAELLYKGGWKKDREAGGYTYIEGGYIPKEDWEFLTGGSSGFGQRIEIDNVIGYAGAERFWEDFVMQEFREHFPNSDITRSVDVPEYVMPKCLEKLNEKVKKKGIEILKDRREKLQDKLANFEGGFLFDRTDNVSDGLLTIPKYEEVLTEHSRHIIESDESIKPLLEEIEELANDDDDDAPSSSSSTSSSSPPPPTRPPIPPSRSTKITTSEKLDNNSIDTKGGSKSDDDDYDYDYEQDSDCNNRKYSFIPKYIMPEALQELNNLVKERAIKITGPERKKLIREIQNGKNIMMLLTDCSVKEHIKDKIESHGSLKTLLRKIEDLTLEYDEDYQEWLKERDEREKQQYGGTPQTKTERRARAEAPSFFDTLPGTYCIIKDRGKTSLPFDATFPPDFTRVYTHTDENGHAYTADHWDRKQRGALTEEEFEDEILRHLPGTLCGSGISCSGPYVDENCSCCYVVYNWGGERDQYGHHYHKKFSGEEWVELVIRGKKQEFRTAPLKNIQYSLQQQQIALRGFAATK
jgi:hypothetical protein